MESGDDHRRDDPLGLGLPTSICSSLMAIPTREMLSMVRCVPHSQH